jgi:hypothetical protein
MTPTVRDHCACGLLRFTSTAENEPIIK